MSEVDTDMGSVIDRRRRARPNRPAVGEFRVSYQVQPGVTQVVQAKLVDLHEEGCGLDIGLEVPQGMPVTVEGTLADAAQTAVYSKAFVSWCRPTAERSFRIGVQFAEPIRLPKGAAAGANGNGNAAAAQSDDMYEILQVSPNADSDTIQRVYRLLAQRYHPDNTETADAEQFRRITDAYKTLSDPEKRAGYDAQYREVLERRWRIFDQPKAVQGVKGEKAKREGVLGLLYTKRVNEPGAPGMAIQEFEQLLGVPREHLEFCLWYLREQGHIARTDNGRYSITVKGVDFAEQDNSSWIRADHLLEAADGSSHQPQGAF